MEHRWPRPSLYDHDASILWCKRTMSISNLSNIKTAHLGRVFHSWLTQYCIISRSPNKCLRTLNINCHFEPWAAELHLFTLAAAIGPLRSGLHHALVGLGLVLCCFGSTVTSPLIILRQQRRKLSGGHLHSRKSFPFPAFSLSLGTNQEEHASPVTSLFLEPYITSLLPVQPPLPPLDQLGMSSCSVAGEERSLGRVCMLQSSVCFQLPWVALRVN